MQRSRNLHFTRLLCPRSPHGLQRQPDGTVRENVYGWVLGYTCLEGPQYGLAVLKVRRTRDLREDGGTFENDRVEGGPVPLLHAPLEVRLKALELLSELPGTLLPRLTETLAQVDEAHGRHVALAKAS